MKQKNKSIALLVSLLLVLTVTVGGTIAFLADTSGPLKNIFNPSQVTTDVDETNEDGVKTNVMITNTGDTEAYIRAAVVITWQDKDGNVYGQMPTTNDYTITWGNGWDEGNDGFYYWPSPVEPNQKTGVLIESVQPVAGKAPADYYLNVEIIGSGIQSVPTSVVANAWGVTVSGTTISK